MADLRIYATIDSTNKEARRLLAEGPVLDGLTLFAHEQTEGRGQYGRTWVAEPGANLTISVIHSPVRLSATDLPVMNMKISLGIVHALKLLNPTLPYRIKWPNDIYVGDKKLGGILIENALSEGRVQHMIIGIGVNVNQHHFPADLPNPVSVYQLTGQTYDLIALADILRQQVMDMLLQSPADWKAEYDRLLYRLNEKHLFQYEGQSIEATVVGVDQDGRLLLKLEDGEVKAFGSNEVRFQLSPLAP